jgi:hypothetical protein
MSQTSYAEQASAFEGMKGDSGNDDVLSRLAEVAVPFGKLVIIGTDKDKQCKLPGAATDITNAKLPLGVSLQTHAMEQSSSRNGYNVNDAASIMHKGRVYVKVEEAVSPSDTPYVRYAAGGNGVGSFGKTAGSTERAALAGARFLTSAGVNGLALLEVDL